MVQKTVIGELAGMPPLFPFQERYLPGKELLRKELYSPIPVWVRGGEEGDRIVWGKCLVERLKGLKIEEVLVRMFGPDDLTLSAALILWTELENKKEGWNTRRYEEFRLLPTPLQQLVAEDKVDLKTALRVKNIPLQTLPILNPILETFSYSERRIFLRFFFEVLQRDHLDTGKGIDLATQLVYSTDPMEELRWIRYPELHRLEKTYHSIADPVLKGTGIKVSPPPYLEGTRFKVEFTFEKGSQLKRKAQILQKLSETIDPVIEHLTHGTK